MQTEWVHLNTDKNNNYTVPFKSFVKISLPPHNRPATVDVYLLEGFHLAVASSTQLAKLKLPIQYSDRESLVEQQFECQKMYSFSHKAVGSLIADGDELSRSATSGSLSLQYCVQNPHNSLQPDR